MCRTLLALCTVAAAGCLGVDEGPARPCEGPDCDADDAGPGDAGTDAGVPPEICREPGAPKGPWFTEVTDEVGLGHTDSLEPLSTGIVAGDLDGDGWDDLVAATFPAQRQPPEVPRTHFVFLSRPDPNDATRRVFVDVTDDTGLFATEEGAGGRGASVWTLGDLDGDGDLDAIGCPGSGEDSVVDPCAAFLNDGAAHFTLAPSSDLDRDVFWVPSSVLLDYDADGLLDFWPGTVGQWAYGPALVSTPKLFRGAGDGTFDDVSVAMGLPPDYIEPGSYRINFGVTSCDVDGDGDRDVLLADYYVMDNYVWLDDGDRFVEVGEALGVAHDDILEPTGYGGNTFSIACADLEDDGDADLMTAEVTHAWLGETADRSEILRNDTPPGEPLARFVRPGNAAMGIERTHVRSDWNEGDNVPLLVDVDLDGKKDVFLFESNYPQAYSDDPEYTHAWLWRQNDLGTFDDVTPETPFGDPAHQSLEGPALVDFDGDGDLDVVVGTGTFNAVWLGLTNTMRAYRNDVGQDSNWTRIRLVGRGAGHSNVSAIGAQVTVTAGGRAQHQEVLGSWGHSNVETASGLTFGLGEACTIDSIEVRWPDAAGTVTRVENVRANYPIEIVEGESGVRYPRVDD